VFFVNPPALLGYNSKHKNKHFSQFFEFISVFHKM
jgi:hypothetical protein